MINKIVSDGTDNEIQEVITETLSEFHKVFILNVVLLKACWPHELPDTNIDFMDGAGVTSSIPGVIYEKPEYKTVCLNKINWQLAWCPFINTDYGVFLGMPDKGLFLEAFEDLSFLANAMETLRRNEWEYYDYAFLPKMKLDSEWDMKSIMEGSGQCCDILCSDNDFSGIAKNLSISVIKQKVCFKLNQYGVTAAAATELLMEDSDDFRPDRIVFNNPFKIWVLHKPTGAILFEGNVTEKPEQPDTESEQYDTGSEVCFIKRMVLETGIQQPDTKSEQSDTGSEQSEIGSGPFNIMKWCQVI